MDAAFLEKQEGGDAGCLRGVPVSLAQTDREQFVHGRWISDIKSVTYGCIPLDRNAGAAVSQPCLFTVTSRKNGSSFLLEIRSAALNGAFIAVEMPPDNRTLYFGGCCRSGFEKTVTDGLALECPARGNAARAGAAHGDF